MARELEQASFSLAQRGEASGSGYDDAKASRPDDFGGPVGSGAAAGAADRAQIQGEDEAQEAASLLKGHAVQTAYEQERASLR